MDINNKYYTENYDSFVADTFHYDMSMQYEFFLKYMPKHGKILDLGFGSGRDMIHFNKLGYAVKGIDPTNIFVEVMSSKGFDVSLGTAQTMEYENEFDGIWASASLLHVPANELVDAFLKCEKALKKEGVLYCSFKYGNNEEVRKGRRFTDLTEESIVSYLKETNFTIVETVFTIDARASANGQKWLNCILKK